MKYIIIIVTYNITLTFNMFTKISTPLLTSYDNNMSNNLNSNLNKKTLEETRDRLYELYLKFKRMGVNTKDCYSSIVTSYCKSNNHSGIIPLCQLIADLKDNVDITYAKSNSKKYYGYLLIIISYEGIKEVFKAKFQKGYASGYLLRVYPDSDIYVRGPYDVQWLHLKSDQIKDIFIGCINNKFTM